MGAATAAEQCKQSIRVLLVLLTRHQDRCATGEWQQPFTRGTVIPEVTLKQHPAALIEPPDVRINETAIGNGSVINGHGLWLACRT